MYTCTQEPWLIRPMHAHNFLHHSFIDLGGEHCRYEIKAAGQRHYEISRLEAELESVQDTVSTLRRSSARLASETSSTRMKMFTRRIRHRNTLLEHGIDSSNTVPPVQATGGASGGETATGMTEVNPGRK